GNPQQDLKDKGVINSGCSRHMIGNRSYLTDYEENLYVKFIVAGNQSNGNASIKAYDDAGKARVEIVPGKDHILLPLWTQDLSFSSSLKDSPDVGFKPSGEEEKKDAKDSEVPNTEEPRVNQEKDENVNSTNNINTVSSTVNAAGIEDNVVNENIVYGCDDDPNMPNLEEIVYSDDDKDVGAEADMTNLDTHIPVSPIPTTRIHNDHPVEQIIRDIYSAPQTRRMTKSVTDHVTRIEAIRLFLAYVSFKDFVVYQMDVKSAFLYGKIEEEVYVYQPLSLESKVMRECCFVVKRDAWLRGKFTLSLLDVLQGFSFFLQMGFTLILATLDGLEEGLLGDVIGEDDCDDDG
ncbi:ribonuclease H-like domain-containing protein, partial [Tanacetum coccineum]